MFKWTRYQYPTRLISHNKNDAEQRILSFTVLMAADEFNLQLSKAKNIEQ